MNRRLSLLFYVAFIVLLSSRTWSQEVPVKEISEGVMRDSLTRMGFFVNPVLKKTDITFTSEEAIKYLQRLLGADYWRSSEDQLKMAIGQLVFYAVNQPYDSLEAFLKRYPYDSLNVPYWRFYLFDTVKIKVPVMAEQVKAASPDSLMQADTIQAKHPSDSIMTWEERPSSLFLKDTCLLIVTDTLNEVKAWSDFHPFTYYRFRGMGDSLSAAVKTLTDFLESRDSSVIVFMDNTGVGLPVWLNSATGNLKRYWLRNEFDDSVTVWIGSTGRDTIGIFLEGGIMFRRPSKHTTINDAQLDIQKVNSRKLQKVEQIYVKPQYWKYRSEASFVFNQALLTNWVKGGENSLSTALDITGYADYVNKDKKIISNNFARLKYGLIKSGDKPVRKNLDLLETNSKLNHKAFGKFDFSATMLFKTQIARGYNYPNDSVPVSKFLNPAILTIGFGLDYKPNKTTSINVAPLSYKATFVPDTARIDQTKYGVSKDRRSMHEPGASVQITNELKPFKTIAITNRLQLFTNYIHNPQNIDIDWEMIAQLKLNWFADLRFNTHFIFDDDTKTLLKNKDGSNVIGPDGKPKKTSRIQFKELMGLSFVFRF